MQKIKQILFQSPLLTAAAVCFVIAAILFATVQENKSPDVKGVAKKERPSATATTMPSITAGEQIVGRQNVTTTNTPTVTQTSTAAQNTAPSATPQPTNPPVQTFQVSLSINGSSVGNVTLEQGANQCDVLNKAKDQGKISSLLMKYDNSLGTNGVYQINGQGKENTIWWTYKINGQSPNQGCSYIKANSGDNIEWNYIGS